MRIFIFILTFLFSTNIFSQENSGFDSLYDYCITYKSYKKEETLKKFEKLKILSKTDTNNLHKAKLYFLNFIIKTKINGYNNLLDTSNSNPDTITSIKQMILVARLLTSKSNTEKAIELLNKAIGLCKERDSLSYINTINIVLAEAYRKDFEYEKAIYLLNKTINNTGVNKADLAYAYSRLAANFNECDNCVIKSRIDSVEKYSILSLKIAKEIKDTLIIATVQNELGNLYLKMKIDYKKSEKYFIDAFNNFKNIKSQENIFAVIINLSNLYLTNNQNAKALTVITKGFDYCTLRSPESVCMRYFLQLANVYQKNKMYYLSYQYLSLGRKIQEQLFKNKIEKNSLDLIAKYNLKLKQAEIEKIKQESLKQKQEKLIYALILFFTVIILIFIILNNRLKNKLQKQKVHSLELENLNLTQKNEYKKLELAQALANIVKQNNTLIDIKMHLKNNDIDKAINTINLNVNSEKNIHEFLKNFNDIYPDFFANLELQHPNISKTDKILSALLLMNLKSTEIANMLCVALATVNKNRQRLRKKLKLPNNSDIAQYLKTLI